MNEWLTSAVWMALALGILIANYDVWLLLVIVATGVLRATPGPTNATTDTVRAARYLSASAVKQGKWLKSSSLSKYD